MNKPWINEDGTIDCPDNGFECSFRKDGKCTLENGEEYCFDLYYYWDEDYLDEVEDEEPDEPYDLDCGFDPYMGCYTDDC